MTALASRDSSTMQWRMVGLLRHPAVARLLSIISFLAVWQFVVPLFPTELIPRPVEVFSYMWEELRGETLAPTTVWEAFGISFRRLGIGLFLSLAVGIPVGVLMGISPFFSKMINDFVVVGLAMPSLVWALLAGIWFGLGNAAPIVTVLLTTVSYVIMNVSDGVRDVPGDLLRMSQAFGVSKRRVFRHVTLASLSPFLFAAMRYSIAQGWKAVVLAEVFASTAGAGWNIQYWRNAHRAPALFGYALFFVIFALLLERGVFQTISRRVFRWRGNEETS